MVGPTATDAMAAGERPHLTSADTTMTLSDAVPQHTSAREDVDVDATSTNGVGSSSDDEAEAQAATASLADAAKVEAARSPASPEVWFTSFRQQSTWEQMCRLCTAMLAAEPHDRPSAAQLLLGTPVLRPHLVKLLTEHQQLISLLPSELNSIIEEKKEEQESQQETQEVQSVERHNSWCE